MAQECRVIQGENATLEKWYNKVREKWIRQAGPGKPPDSWWGLFDDEDLVAAFGIDVPDDDSVFVSAALCEPSRRGLAGLWTLALHLRWMAERKRVRFWWTPDQRRMVRLVRTLYGAKLVATVWEIDNREG